MDPNTTKTLIKAAIKSKSMGPQPISATTKFCNKAIILSEKIITPARDTTSLNSTMKRSYEDVEDIKSYIITKNQKLDAEKSDMPFSKVTGSTLSKTPFIQSTKQIILNAAKQMTGVAKSSGKAKILNQTIIRPAGEMFQEKSSTSVEDNIEFDINSMPIVISDELLTAESLENMPIVLGDNIQKTQNMENMKVIVEKKHPPSNTKLVNKTVAVPSIMASTVRMPAVRKMQTTKILQTSGQTQKINRHASPVMTTSKSKYIVLPESPNRTIQMAKKPNIVRRSVAGTGVVDSTAQNVSSESTGHKIMIVTNQQGQQQRVLLTPAQQKMFGMQLPKAGKTVVKSVGNQKVLLNKGQTISTTSASTSKIQGQFISSTKASSKPQICTTQIVSPQIKLAPPRKAQKLCLVGSQINKPATQKTILIKNQHGQTVRKIQGTDDALLDKQVAEQLEAIKVSSLKAQQRQQELSAKTSSVAKQIPNITRKPYSKRPEIKQTLTTQTKQSFHLSPPNVSGISKLSERGLPPLAPIKADKKSEDLPRQAPETKPIENKPSDRPLNQVVIQDNMGNQTTVTEGQILAVANETVDGQPKSYMLVTVDEAGNFTPLNNETLMSLDPSLAGLTRGDLSNMVLQMDPAGIKDGANTVSQLQAPSQEKVKIDEETSAVFEKEISTKPLIQTPQHPDQVAAQVQVTCNINGEPGQQIILSGDPIATQKFLDSLSEGNTDLANILAHAEGSSFLIQTDDQQILINTGPTDTQMSQSTTTIAEQPEQGNPMFATHPIKNQDILAAALADTDVFQQDQVTNQSKVLHSQLSPGQNLFPLNVGNVLETSLTLNSPIMTPLEVPSTNSKIIPDEEADILTTHVPKNVDLPITITDPNISQTVSHQQVLMASDLQTNLELSLPISETAISVTSEMNSPSFVYSLPNLDVAEHTEISQKSFSSSMPLLTEDIDETSITATTISVEEKLKLQQTDSTGDSPCREKVPHINIAETLSNRRSGMITSDGTFMEEGLCTLGGEMCSSLSEPPPEMFDIPISNDSLQFLSTKSQNGCKEKSHTSTMEPALLADENSMEIPVQPQIVADLKDPSEEAQNSVSDETPMERKVILCCSQCRSEIEKLNDLIREKKNLKTENDKLKNHYNMKAEMAAKLKAEIETLTNSNYTMQKQIKNMEKEKIETPSNLTQLQAIKFENENLKLVLKQLQESKNRSTK
ncbi:hypothetical protein HHI36_017121 [Cryptolaemus montrouzieri]|uniref:Uncharacterized protein n=1 Tax=Cryptolaemus montrouzieri TaxID=559131 RepID=A0ABD2NM26_9CUCU